MYPHLQQLEYFQVELSVELVSGTSNNIEIWEDMES